MKRVETQKVVRSVWEFSFDGYPVNYEPVTLGKSVWLPWRVFLMPGTTIGDGSVIGANSLVSGTIPPNSLAVGSPAKVIRSAPDFPRKVGDDERRRMVGDMVSEFERYMASEGVTVSGAASARVFATQKGSWRLLQRGPGASLPELQRGDTLLTDVALDGAGQTELRERGAYWLDLRGKTRSETGSPLTEELATFLGRYGIRLPRA